MAQFYPNTAAFRYCKLRELGVDYDTALRMAIAENVAPQRNSPIVNYSGTRVTVDTAEFVDGVSKLCPAYLRRP
jgi:hypothetical protein